MICGKYSALCLKHTEVQSAVVVIIIIILPLPLNLHEILINIHIIVVFLICVEYILRPPLDT